MSILEGLPRNTSAEAIDDTELIEINSTTFDKMIKGNIEIAIRLLRKLSIKLRAAEQKIEELRVAGPAAPAPLKATVAPSAQPTRGVTEGLRLVAPDDGVAYSLKEPETLIGRYDPVTELKPDVDLTDLDLKRSVSRRHARIVRNGSGYSVVEEVGALNGTFVNGTKLETGEPHPLKEGDELAVGMVKLFFHV
jgi:CRP-like cAMP-binding protein